MSLALRRDDDRAGAALEVAAMVLVAMAAYTWRLLEDVGFWDTAIFQAAPPTLGLTHPTGFPTFNILGWLWTAVLPLGSAAYEMNLFTALTGALAVGMVYVVSRQLRAGRLLSAGFALGVGLMVAWWRTSARADPHPLHVLLALVVVSLLLAWNRGRRPRMLAFAALAFGLGMGNHMLMAMLAPGVAVYVLTAQPRVLREPRTILLSALGLVAGLAVYLYVPVRAAANPAIHYDYNPTTLDQVLRYVLGRDFAGQMAFFSTDGPGVALRELGTAWRQLSEGTTAPIAVILVVLAVVGFAGLLADRQWRTAWLLGSTGGLTLYARLTYQNGDLERYALFPYAVLAILAAVGAQRLWSRRMRGSGGEPVSLGRRPWSIERSVVRVLPGVALVIPILLVSLNGGAIRIADARCYLTEAAHEAPPDAAIVSWWSLTTPLWYGQAVEGLRPDVVVRSAASTVVDEINAFQAEGRPVVIVQLEGELAKVREAGFPMTELDWCGQTAWQITGPAGSAPAAGVLP